MTDFIFIHGGNVSGRTWNQVVQRKVYPKDKKLGGKIWQQLSIYLSFLGHQVYTPTLSDEYKNNLSDHINEICQLIDKNCLTDIILVGHSYGGMVITGVADRKYDSIKDLVYLDAALPDNGQSLFDLLKLSNFNPSTIIEGLPKAYIEKINLKDGCFKDLNKYYIRCTQSGFGQLTALSKQKILMHPKKWCFQEIETGHLPMATKLDWLKIFFKEMVLTK